MKSSPKKGGACCTHAPNPLNPQPLAQSYRRRAVAQLARQIPLIRGLFALVDAADKITAAHVRRQAELACHKGKALENEGDQ
jgi:hypothetical protein